MCFGTALSPSGADVAAPGAVCRPLDAVADGSGGRVVGALTMSSLSLSSSLRISNRCWGKKKPPSAGPLYEGRALMLVAMPGRGQARHQLASQLLRASPGSA